MVSKSKKLLRTSRALTGCAIVSAGIMTHNFFQGLTNENYERFVETYGQYQPSALVERYENLNSASSNLVNAILTTTQEDTKNALETALKITEKTKTEIEADSTYIRESQTKKEYLSARKQDHNDMRKEFIYTIIGILGTGFFSGCASEAKKASRLQKRMEATE